MGPAEGGGERARARGRAPAACVWARPPGPAHWSSGSPTHWHGHGVARLRQPPPRPQRRDTAPIHWHSKLLVRVRWQGSAPASLTDSLEVQLQMLARPNESEITATATQNSNKIPKKRTPQ